ncbi:MAG: BirA family transcriptional regulator [Thermomicrobiales bacterium]|jgi:BirA family biotin operon repressor/biotin-[acetyl-CoA-carboxylase] ligase|nr:BirA family transcriptional regulator [Thermomicrobiales bacterium]MEA2585291.1 BirA family transcriptional regulator [Thermomicrobiales bacterium]
MRIGHTILSLPVTTSTMDDVDRHAQGGATEGLVVVADEQTAGQGRAGRSWSAPAGSALLCSILLRPSLPPNRLSTLPLVAGVAVAEAIEDCAPVSCRLKWPNDVWIDGRKVAGLLMKATTSVRSVDRVVLGIGINLTARSEDLAPGATSIWAASGVVIERSSLLDALLSRLQTQYDRFVDADGRPDLTPWRNRAALLDQMVTVEDAATRIGGRLHGVDDDGALLIDVAGELRRIVAGDLTRGPVPEPPGPASD